MTGVLFFLVLSTFKAGPDIAGAGGRTRRTETSAEGWEARSVAQPAAVGVREAGVPVVAPLSFQKFDSRGRCLGQGLTVAVLRLSSPHDEVRPPFPAPPACSYTFRIEHAQDKYVVTSGRGKQTTRTPE